MREKEIVQIFKKKKQEGQMGRMLGKINKEGIIFRWTPQTSTRMGVKLNTREEQGLEAQRDT
jgi:hypothetical protein